MRLEKLFTLQPELKKQWTSLIEEPTPTYRLTELGRRWGHSELYIKREDLTDFRYGGNKVRNLEFILGHAQSTGAQELMTLAPLGSNFIAALAAQSNRVGLKTTVYHFVPERNEQIYRHAKFSEDQGTQLSVSHLPLHLGLSWSALQLAWGLSSRTGAYAVPVGGSNWRGALGHVGSALELAEQVKKGEIPEPDFIVVGAGTCGTIAGLWVGLRLAGLKTKIIGVRCVDRVLCHRAKITRIAKEIGRRLGLSIRLHENDFQLVDPAGHNRYAVPLEGVGELATLFRETEGLVLDSTYTSKVAYFMGEWLKSDEAKSARVVYWHTFSSAAMNWGKSAFQSCAPKFTPLRLVQDCAR